MSAEAIAGTAAGVTAASVALVFDQSLAMASVGGCFLYLGVSIAIPVQTRIFFSLGSFVLGYIVGMGFMSYGGVDPYAAVSAFLSSATGSAVFGSLHKWFDGGETPVWIKFFSKLLPFSWKKGGSDE
jgi:predicted Co/Zn/Cd cation transporter (cation efflux family)